MYKFHRCHVADVSVTAARASNVLTVNRDNNREILLSVSSKDRKYRAYRMAARIVADIISKEKTTKQIYFANEQVDTMQDIIIPITLLYKNRHSSKTEEYLSERWELIISQAVLTFKAMTHKLTRSALIPLAKR